MCMPLQRRLWQSDGKEGPAAAGAWASRARRRCAAAAAAAAPGPARPPLEHPPPRPRPLAALPAARAHPLLAGHRGWVSHRQRCLVRLLLCLLLPHLLLLCLLPLPLPLLHRLQRRPQPHHCLTCHSRRRFWLRHWPWPVAASLPARPWGWRHQCAPHASLGSPGWRCCPLLALHWELDWWPPGHLRLPHRHRSWRLATAATSSG